MTTQVGWWVLLWSAVSLAGRAIPIGAAQAAHTSERRVTFSKDVAPIFFRRCASCHHPGTVAPFSVLAYADVRPRASLIARVTRMREMPPWKAEADSGDFVGMQPLTQAEIDLIERWVEDGAPQGDVHDLPPPPHYSEDGWQLGTPDMVVRTERYTLQPGRTDEFRVFVVPLPVSVTRYVRGVEFLPRSPSIHHANILLDRTRRSRELDERDPSPGYEGLMARSAEYPQGYFLGWTNGQPDLLAPSGLSWPLAPGTDLVVALHLQRREHPEIIEPAIGLYFSDDPPTATPELLRLGRQNIDIPPGDAHYEITDSYTLPVAVDVLSLKPHAHYRAREIRADAVLPRGTVKPLLHIKDWDFHWQHVYRFAVPLELPQGTTLEMRYSYDNSDRNPRNPVRPAARTRWGPLSSDEMGDLWIQVLPGDKQGSQTLQRDFRRKWAAEDAVGYESLLMRDPGNEALHDDAGVLYLELGQAKQAVPHFEASARVHPDSPDALFNLATALMVDGRLDEAVRLYKQVLSLNPRFAAAHTNLGNVFSSQGDVQAAIAEYEQALVLQPDNALAHNNLGNALLSIGKLDAALGQFQEALRLNPRLPDPHYNTALVLKNTGQLSRAILELKNVIDLAPDPRLAMTDLAWVLATARDDRLRDGREAVRLAEQATALSKAPDSHTLDVLAAAYAANGRFDDAVRTVLRAIALNPAPPALQELRNRRGLYERHAQYFDPQQD